MLCNKTSVDLSPQEIEVIEAALRTQEKILTVQSRAGGDSGVQGKLSQLQAVLRNLQRQQPLPPSSGGFGQIARSLFG